MTREMAIQVLQTALTSPFIYGEYAEAINMAIEALSAEAVKVVRCKDCKFKDSETGCPLGELLDDKGFCSLGERREDGEEE